MKKLFFVCTALLGCAAAFCAPGDLKNFNHTKIVQKPYKAPASQFNCILLDREVYKELNESSSNLLLTDTQDKLVPFVLSKLQKFQKRSSYTPLPGKITDFKIDHDTNTAVIEYAAELEKDQKIGKLELQSPRGRKFNKSLVLKFADGSTVADLKYFNHKGTVDFSRCSFELPPQKSGQVKIVIHPFAEKRDTAAALVRSGDRENFTEQRIITEELSLNKIVFYAVKSTVVPTGDVVETLELPNLQIKGKADQSVWIFDLQKTPVSSLKVFSATLNYHRHYELEFYNNTADGKKTLRKFTGIITPNFQLSFDELRADAARLTVENQADQPLAQAAFHWTIPQYALKLAPEHPAPQGYKLYYGGSGKTPEFDLKHYIDKFSNKEYTLWQLSESVKNKTTEEDPSSTWVQWMQKLLPYVVGAAALLLAFFSIKMLRSAKFESDEDM